MRKLLAGKDLKSAATEIERLEKSGKSVEQIARALGIRKDGTVRPLLFSGSVESERKLIAKLNPEQRKAYAQAQQEHALLARKFRWIVGSRKKRQRVATAP